MVCRNSRRTFSSADAVEGFGQIPKSFYARAGHEQNSGSPDNHQKGPRQAHGSGLCAFCGEFLLRALLPRFTLAGERALAAARIARNVHGCAQLHQRLIPAPRVARVEEPVRFFLNFCIVIVEQAHDHAADVSIHRGVR